ncbi:MAG: 16S rRNA (guanine(527)-N(7))-methyltransferase RsmG [Rhodobacteraceae bacterium]|nr:16S rRNA (guanine(527)-N(7))-methyltransferase RsmG [Paracoccaceae bacterium]
MIKPNAPQREKFETLFDVPRETMEQLAQYEVLLTKWNQKINLVAPSTIPDIWHRHFADSAQLWSLRNLDATNWLDIGSGAGFPALVLAIFAKKQSPNLIFTLVESDQRKCAFLINVAQALDLNIIIKPERIENLASQPFDMISARALSSLPELLEISEPFCKESTICLFPKGNRYELELTKARKTWHIEEQKIPSLTDAESVILRIESFSRA